MIINIIYSFCFSYYTYFVPGLGTKQISKKLIIKRLIFSCFRDIPK